MLSRLSIVQSSSDPIHPPSPCTSKHPKATTLGSGLDLVLPNIAQQTSILCKYLYLIHAPHHCLKPGQTRDYVSQLSTQLGVLHKLGFHLLAYTRI